MAAQQALKDKGRDPGMIDGKMGRRTRAALALDRAFALEPHSETLLLRGRMEWGAIASAAETLATVVGTSSYEVKPAA